MAYHKELWKQVKALHDDRKIAFELKNCCFQEMDWKSGID